MNSKIEPLQPFFFEFFCDARKQVTTPLKKRFSKYSIGSTLKKVRLLQEVNLLKSRFLRGTVSCA